MFVTDSPFVSELAEKNKLRVFSIEKDDASVTEKIGEVVDT